MHTDTTPTTGACPACHRRDPEIGLVCEPCRVWLPAALRGINERYGQLPHVLVPGARPTEHVTGSTDPAAPLNLDAEDLLTRVVRDGGIPIDSTPDTITRVAVLTRVIAPWWQPIGRKRWRRYDVEELHRRYTDVPGGDQIGHLPTAQVLDSWVRSWIDARAYGEHRPTPTVPVLTAWLIDRLDWACDHYPAMDDFAASVRSTRGTLMAVLGEFDPPPVPCDGVECERCDKRLLVRATDGSGDVTCENPDCRKVYRPQEYADWTRRLAGHERSTRDPRQIAELLRRRDPLIDADTTS